MTLTVFFYKYSQPQISPKLQERFLPASSHLKSFQSFAAFGFCIIKSLPVLESKVIRIGTKFCFLDLSRL